MLRISRAHFSTLKMAQAVEFSTSGRERKRERERDKRGRYRDSATNAIEKNRFTSSET